jgi:predicted molibdopterin-dependent oxidoreductase YjgC
MQRVLRGAGGTSRVGLGPAGGAEALAHGMAAVTDAPRSSATFQDLRDADVVLVLRADPTRTHPLIKSELTQGVHQRGQKLLLAHALSGGLERHAALYLPLEPAGEEPLLHAAAARLLDLEPQAADPLRDLGGFPEWVASLRGYRPEAIAEIAGVPPPTLDAFCAVLAASRKAVIVVVTGLGIPGDEAAVTRAAAQLDAVLGARGGGVLVLGEKANLQGLLDVGMYPEWLPGGPGQPAGEAISGDGHQQVGLLYLAGQDPAGAWPRGLRGAELVDRAAFLVVHEAFLTETAHLADVVLPVAVLAERQGSMVGADGVRRRVNRVLAPPGNVPQDGALFLELARRLGVPLPKEDALERELAMVTARALPRPTVRRFVSARPLAERAPRKGMRLDTSPQLFRSGSITDRSRLLQELAPSAALRLSPRDAGELGVHNGDAVRLATGGRETLLRARLDPTVRRGTLLARSRARWDAAASLVRHDEPTAAEIRRS